MCNVNCWHCIHNGGITGVPLCCPVCPVRKVVRKCVIDEGKWQTRVCCLPKMTRPCSCGKLDVWYERSSNVICALARRFKRSNEFIQYLLLNLLSANYGQMLNLKGPLGASYYNPLAGFHDEEHKNIFDSWGNLLDPLDPNNILRLMQVLQHYVRNNTNVFSGATSAVNHFDGLAAILGPDDSLVKLLRDINSNIAFPFDTEDILNVLEELDIEELAGESPPLNKFNDFVKSIEEVYNSVVQGNLAKPDEIVPKKINGFDKSSEEVYNSEVQGNHAKPEEIIPDDRSDDVAAVVTSSIDSVDSKRLLSEDLELLQFAKLMDNKEKRPSKKSIRLSKQENVDVFKKLKMLGYPSSFNKFKN